MYFCKHCADLSFFNSTLHQWYIYAWNFYFMQMQQGSLPVVHWIQTWFKLLITGSKKQHFCSCWMSRAALPQWNTHTLKSVDSTYLGFVLLHVRGILQVCVGVCLLHADQLQFEVRQLIHQIQLLGLKRGPAHQLLRKTHIQCTSHAGKRHRSKQMSNTHTNELKHTQLLESRRVRVQHVTPLSGVCSSHTERPG